MRTLWPCAVPGTWVPAVHANCHHNERSALLQRTLKPTPCPEYNRRRPFLNAVARVRGLARKYCGERWDYETTAESYKGLLRRRYTEACESLNKDGPINHRDVKIKGFLKAEKVRVEKISKPRMIFPRSPRYNLHIASWLKPFEHWLWGNLKSRRMGGIGNTRVVAKGLNHVQRANLIARKMRAMPECVVFEVDGSSFEAHVDEWQLVQEHSIYLAAYPGSSELERALSKQLYNYGKTTNGISFSRDGGRASGDFNTGMGNSLIMLCVVSAVMKSISVPWDTLVDGDNALLFLRRTDLDRVCKLFHRYAVEFSGHEMVLEKPTDVLEGVRFGQCAPLRLGGELRMVRDWKKILSQSLSSHRHLNQKSDALAFARGVALCETSLAHNVPIVWQYTRCLLKLTDSHRKANQHMLADYVYLGVNTDELKLHEAREPAMSDRISFERGYGVCVEEQLIIERMIAKQMEPGCGGAELNIADVYDYMR